MKKIAGGWYNRTDILHFICELKKIFFLNVKKYLVQKLFNIYLHLQNNNCFTSKKGGDLSSIYLLCNLN